MLDAKASHNIVFHIYCSELNIEHRMMNAEVCCQLQHSILKLVQQYFFKNSKIVLHWNRILLSLYKT